MKTTRSVDPFKNLIATPALVASIINGKYVNALPIERQAKAYKKNGINLATNTMANWVIKSSKIYLSLIYYRLHELIYENKVIHIDETPTKIMRINGEKIIPSSFTTGSHLEKLTILGSFKRLLWYCHN